MEAVEIVSELRRRARSVAKREHRGRRDTLLCAAPVAAQAHRRSINPARSGSLAGASGFGLFVEGPASISCERVRSFRN